MLHRSVLEAIAAADDKSPFGADAKSAAQAVVEGAGLETDLEAVGASPRDTFLLLWRCVAAAHTIDADETSAGEFVVTLPRGVPKGARPTNIVVKEMLDAAKGRVIILGYSFTADGGIVQQLGAAAARGVEIVAVCDRVKGGPKVIDAAWPSFVARPTIYINPETEDDMHKMHCKLLVVDDRDLLVTSANFTYHGMLGNIEFGVRLRDVASSKAAKSFVEHLISTRAVLPHLEK